MLAKAILPPTHMQAPPAFEAFHRASFAIEGKTNVLVGIIL